MNEQMWIFLVIVVVASSADAKGSSAINMTTYYQMPPMHVYEPYDKCLDERPEIESLYCIVNVLLEPNNSNPIWNIVQNYSQDEKHHYRHDRLTRGICMNACRKKIEYYDYQTRMTYYVKTHTDNVTSFDPNIFRNALVRRGRNHKKINMCVNHELKHDYGLQAQTSIVYCISNMDQIEIDTVDESFLVLVIILLLTIILSSSYDFYLKKNNLPHLCNIEHYKRPVPGKCTTILVSFSLSRNWYRLIGDSNDEVARDLRPINAIKFLFMYGVVLAHIGLFVSVSPTDNPQFMESQYYGLWTMLLINGANVLQIYFAITGYLLSIQFMEIREKTKFNLSILWKSIIYRYMRYTPVYAFIIFFNSTWLVNLQEGPFWLYIVETERTFCRENWWTNLLFINNFVNADNPCVQHAWYLAADLQLVIVGTIIHLIIWRFPKATKQILGLSVIAAFFVQGYVTYANKLEGIFMALPERLRFSHLFDQAYLISYVPSYVNCGGFILGMIGGIIYCEQKRGNINLKKNKVLVTLWYSIVPVCILTLLSGYIFYANNYEKPALWIAIYSVFIRSMWGLAISILVTGIALGTGWIIRDIFRMPVFRALGRLTFGAYLIHPVVARVMNGNIRSPIYVSRLRMIENVTSIFVVSFIVSLVLAMAIEMPSSAIQKLIFKRDRAIEKDYKVNPQEVKPAKECTLELSAKIVHQ